MADELNLTDEQLEAKELTEIREGLDNAIAIGKSLEALKGNPHFKVVFEELFLKNGLSILWENTRHLTEEQLKGRGNDRNLEVLEMLKGQIKTRLDFDGFMDTIENDYSLAVEELAELDADAGEKS